MSDKRDIVFVSTIHRMSERLLPVFEALSSDFNVHNVRIGQASQNTSYSAKERFDQDLSGKEDRYWARDMISMGHTLKFDPALVCRHYWTSRGATWRDDEDLL